MTSREEPESWLPANSPEEQWSAPLGLAMGSRRPKFGGRLASRSALTPVGQCRITGVALICLMLLLGSLLLTGCGDPAAPAPARDTTPPTFQPVLRPRPIERDRTAEAPPAVLAPSTTVALRDAVGFVQVAVGENHACALQGNGDVHCWGSNDEGQLDVPEDARFRQITAGYRFTCGIRINGSIACWGRNSHGQLDAPVGDFSAVDAGWDHACALSAGTASCWGWNANARATPPSDVAFTAIGAGAEHSCGLTTGRDLVCWGKNDDGRAESIDGPLAALALGTTQTCTLDPDGRAACRQATVSRSSPASEVFQQISSGSKHACAITTTGSVECWSVSEDEVESVRLRAPKGQFTSIGTGWSSTCAIDTRGNAECWRYFPDFDRPPPFDTLHFEDAFPGRTFAQPTALLSWPTGGTLVVDRGGSISIHSDTRESQVVLDLQAEQNQDMLILSAALDPRFPEFPYLYVYYHTFTGADKLNAPAKLSRLTIRDGRAIRADELIIIDIPRQKESFQHHGGEIRFGHDGMLYLGIGDAECYVCPQSLDSLHGKIIRIDIRSASVHQPYKVPEDNPFVSVANARPEVWAYGLRNPWRMAFDQQDNKLWVGDVGHNDSEEINIVTPGANLGWPVFEGFECFEFIPEATDLTYEIDIEYSCRETKGTTFPIFTYSHTGSQCALIGGQIYHGNAIPWLTGSYLFGDYCSGEIWILDRDATMGRRAVDLANLATSFVSFGSDAAGELYVLNQHGPILRLVEDEAGYLYVPTGTIMPPTPTETDDPGGA